MTALNTKPPVITITVWLNQARKERATRTPQKKKDEINQHGCRKDIEKENLDVNVVSGPSSI
jgi:hypothetical protein